MTAIANTMTNGKHRKAPTNLLWLAAALAAGLAVAVALLTLARSDPGTTPRSAADESAAREERIAFFEQRAAADPIDFVSLNVLAAEYLQRARATGDVTNYELAEAAALGSLELITEDNYSALVSLAGVRLAQHDFAAAEQLAQQARVIKSREIAPLGLLADAQVGLGLYDEAGQTLQTMLELDGGLPTLSRLAHFAFLRGDTFNAVEFWRQAIDRSEGLPAENVAWTWVQLGVTQADLGNLEAASASIETALDIYPGYIHGLEALASVRALQGRTDEAIALYSRAVASNPAPADLAALGYVYLQAGSAAGAQAQFERVEAVTARWQAAGINTDLDMAVYYADRDIEPAKALQLARAAYDAAPSLFAADAVAWALYRNGQYEEAAQYSAEALTLGTFEPAFYTHAALISQALKDDAAVQEHLDGLAAFNPQQRDLTLKMLEDASR